MENIKQITVNDILNKCPGPIISRQQAATISGGLISERHLANLDCLKQGPAGRVKIGRRVGYVAESFASWLASRIETKNAPPAPNS